MAVVEAVGNDEVRHEPSSEEEMELKSWRRRDEVGWSQL
jgi:hypothetical protein